MNEPILITGCARSGTSLIAGIINQSGAFGGNMSGPNSNNPKGMFENARIRNSIVKPYFRSIDVDPLGQYPLPDVTDLPIPTAWRSRVEEIIQHEGYKDGPWMYKGAKMCLHWPVWHYAFPKAKWIIVRRKDEDIVNSCMRTGFMRAFHNPNNLKAVGARNEKEGWQWWVDQHKARFREMMDEGLNLAVIWPQHMIDGDYSQVKNRLEWLRLEWSLDVPEFIEPKLWKARNKKKPIKMK